MVQRAGQTTTFLPTNVEETPTWAGVHALEGREDVLVAPAPQPQVGVPPTLVDEIRVCASAAHLVNLSSAVLSV